MVAKLSSRAGFTRREFTAFRLNAILAKHTGQPIEVIAKDTDRDRYLSADQAKAYGLVDEVLIAAPKKTEIVTPMA